MVMDGQWFDYESLWLSLHMTISRSMERLTLLSGRAVRNTCLVNMV